MWPKPVARECCLLCRTILGWVDDGIDALSIGDVKSGERVSVV
jgi:hypothetical protein